MPDVPFVFISSTTRDLEEERKQVAHWVNQHGCHAVLQNVFAGEPDTTTIPALLDKHLKPCAAVIHLCGFYFGSGPKDASPPISYTRMEYEYGKEKSLPVMVLLADETKYLPLCPAQTGDNAKLQRGYYDGFNASTGMRYSFTDIKDLEGHVTSFLKKHGIGTETPIPLHNLPFSSIGEKFVGREQVMEDLAQALEKGAGAAALTSVAAVHALGGLGKTRVAIEHAWHSRDRYTALLFVKAASSLLPTEDSVPAMAVDPLMGPVASLSNVLKLNIEATEEAAHYRAVLDWFQNHRNWLLIIDNVDTKEAQVAVNALLPRLTNGHVLITSRLSTWSGAVRPLEIGKLGDADGAALILRAIGERQPFNDTEAGATEISRELGGHALALQQAAAYILRSRISLEKYLEKWRTQRDELLKRTELPPDYPLTVSATLEITFAELSPGARFLLDALSFFASAPIPRYVVESIVLPDDADTAECLLELFDWHIAESGENGDTVTVHGLIQILRRRRLQNLDDDQVPLGTAALALGHATGDKEPQDVRNWPIIEPLVPHLLEMGEFLEPTEYAISAGRFFIKVGILLKSKARHNEAEPLFIRALSIGESNFGVDHPAVAVALNNLAEIYIETNESAKSEPLFRRAIDINEMYFGEKHPNTIASLNNFAALLLASNREDEAEQIYLHALSSSEELYDKDHPKVALSLNNLAAFFHKTGRLELSEPLYQRALRINEQKFGLNHPLVALNLNNLAELFRATDRSESAEPLYRRALQIDELFLGENHPDVARDLNNLALLLFETDRAKEAEPYSRKQLKILIRFGKRTGYQHFYLSRTTTNYVNILRKLGLDADRITDRLNRLSTGEEVEDLS